MSEQDAFGPNLRRLRVQRGVTLEQIAASTKIGRELWASMERNDFSRWPAGIYARAYLRAYAAEVGADPDVTVEEFCRWFPQGDRRAERVVREQAVLAGHNLQWKDDVAADTNRRSASPGSPGSAEPERPVETVSPRGRIAAALADGFVVLAVGLLVSVMSPIGRAWSIAACAMLYHAVALATLGCTPATWAIDLHLASRHPSAARVRAASFPRFLRSSERVKV
jgi:transcriptional regulator with XRE-family HTH domain